MQIEQKTITSVEVAEMVGKDHKELLRDIRRYSEQLGESKIALTEFFGEGMYTNLQNKELPCYLITRKGCEFISNKLTGVKGTAFTARYINAFHTMEDKLLFDITNLSPELQAIIAHDKKLQAIVSHMDNQDNKITEVENDFTVFKNDLPLLGVECDKITASKNYKVVPLLGGKESVAYHTVNLRSRVYRDLENQIRREFGVKSYKAIKRNQCDMAVSIINKYSLPLTLAEEIEYVNSQTQMEV